MSLPASVRAFIAIPLPPEIQKGLFAVEAGLKPVFVSAVRWVAPESIHITLKFLGDMPLARVRQIQDILKRSADLFSPFSITVEGIGAFPNPQRARVIWVGLQAGPELMKLQAFIDQETARIGFASENRAFSPHLTIGRVNQTATAADLSVINASLKSSEPVALGSFMVQAITLFKSDLRPSGAIYTVLSENSLLKN